MRIRRLLTALILGLALTTVMITALCALSPEPVAPAHAATAMERAPVPPSPGDQASQHLPAYQPAAIARPQGDQLSEEPPGDDLPSGVSAEWWAKVQEQLRQEMYHLGPAEGTQAAAYRGHNLAHNLDITFDASGVRLTPGTPSWHDESNIPPPPLPGKGKGEPWGWGLTLAAAGYAGAMQPVPAAELIAAGNRVEYRRGTISEWYVNDQRGLEQGFTITAPPPGGKGRSPLRLDLALSGDLIPVLSDDGQSIDFTTLDGVAVLRYSQLHAYDASGRQLPARLSLSHRDRGTIRITVEDAGAAYPLTIDPLATSPGWTATGENNNDWFGLSVAGAGDVNGDGYADVIVGARGYISRTGKAYVYHGSSSGLSATPALTATGENIGDDFGFSVATAGDVNGDGYADVIVGASGYVTTTGRAYVYHGSGGGLSATPAFTATGENIGQLLGISVATAGDVNGDGYADVIIGASGYPGWAPKGRAYVYHGGASGLSSTPAFSATGEIDYDRLGISVATAGDVNGDGYADVIVGAYAYDDGKGRAYVHHGSVAGLAATPALTFTGEYTGDLFGYSVATAGDVNGDGYADVIVGAKGYLSSSRKGKAYVYHGSASGLSATPAFTATGEDNNEHFGISVAGARDVNGDGYADVIVGAYGYPAGSSKGKVYIYPGGSAGLSATPAFTATGENNQDGFGMSVAGAGDVDGDGYADVIVGAEYNAASRQGKAYAYHGGGAGLSATPGFSATGEGGGHFGYSVAGAGDVNGDSYADVIVGAYSYNSDQGKAYVYHGGDTGLNTTPAFSATGESTGDQFGISVAGAGDVNGDGYADVIVGARSYETSKGKAYVYHGGGSGLSATPAFSVTGENTGDSFGISVAGAGDVNGDGYADVIVGAKSYSNSKGKAYVYHGGGAGLSATPAFSATGETHNDRFGWSVASAGDVNGDGYADAIVGAYGYPSLSSKGKAYVYHGGVGGLSATPAFTATGENDGDYFGRSVATAGDVNGDGYADVIVGARGYLSDTGRATVYRGGSVGLSSTPAFTATGENNGDYFGYSVAGAGDVNGDGYADVIVGAYGYVNGSNKGRATVYHGSGGGLSATPAFTATGENTSDYFGHSVAGAGDVNGDGYADVMVGAYGHNTRKATVYQGSDGGGRLVLPRQERAAGGTLVQPWGRSHAADSFQVRLTATDPIGRGRVKLQVQTCPPGVPFGHASCLSHTSATWTDVTASSAGTTLNTTISGLTDGTLYRWRARVLYVPFHVTESGITPPPNPAHGPWRRFLGQAMEADLRTDSAPALSIDKTVTPDTDVSYRGEVTYTVILGNSGQTDATSTLLTDTLPLSTTFARWVAQAGASFDAGPPQEITWSGTVAAGEAIAFTFVVTHTGDYAEVVTNTARYSHASSSGSDDAGFSVTGPPGLSIDKTVNPDTNVSYRGEVTYTVILGNSGQADATSTLLTDTLPLSTTFARWVAQAGASLDPGLPQEITWGGTVTASQAITFTFVVSHTGDYAEVVTNTARYSHSSGSGSDNATFVVGPVPLVYLPVIVKSD